MSLKKFESQAEVRKYYFSFKIWIQNVNYQENMWYFSEFLQLLISKTVEDNFYLIELNTSLCFMFNFPAIMQIWLLKVFSVYLRPYQKVNSFYSLCVFKNVSAIL